MWGIVVCGEPCQCFNVQGVSLATTPNCPGSSGGGGVIPPQYGVCRNVSGGVGEGLRVGGEDAVD